ncbi:phage late control D family protein [Pseudomonas sp. URMO17WK12:I11]|uniref:phage late control D family protein n=1 Tax=Pseudomonas sp. URMO17WK12:I11 TaxID=1283291 RepID=UPI0011A4C77E|nr:contractile injection system protein, VgrG/Pvc8 family [Pseudomonas sp. URMO17WK12:I11]
MRPQFRIHANGREITALINDRLLLLRTTDKPGMQSDDFELRIDARDAVLALPARGALIELHMGYADQSLTRLGRYTVDEVELSGPPDTLVIRGKASDLRGTGRSIRSGSWEAQPLQRIVNDIAARNGWQAACPVLTPVPRIDQLNESDFNFITRLARQYDCTAKLAEGRLLVLPRQGGQSASGQPLDVLVIEHSAVSQWHLRLDDKAARRAVRTRHQDPGSGECKTVELLDEAAAEGQRPVHTDPHLYPNRAAAEQAARARLASFNRDTAQLRLVMPGRTDLFAERSIDLQGFVAGVDGQYQIDSVEQLFTGSGWTTTVQANGGKAGKANAKGAAQTGQAVIKAR